MRRFLGIIVLLLNATTTSGFDCSVSCPTGYLAGCVKSENACDCYCRKEVKDLRLAVVDSLKASGVSKEASEGVGAALPKRPGKFEKTVMEDGKQFTITIRKIE